jgi:hypothetical protein
MVKQVLDALDISGYDYRYSTRLPVSPDFRRHRIFERRHHLNSDCNRFNLDDFSSSGKSPIRRPKKSSDGPRDQKPCFPSLLL